MRTGLDFKFAQFDQVQRPRNRRGGGAFVQGENVPFCGINVPFPPVIEEEL